MSSLCFHIEELTTLKAPLNSVQILGYNFEFTPTEYNNGNTALYIKKGLNYKLRNGIQIYKSKQLESTLTEITQDKEHIVVGCIYRRATIELGEFNSHYLTNLLEKLSLENKTLVLLEDFNANLLKYDIDTGISNFLDLMYSSFLLPHIVSPALTTEASATLIDNIFTNNCNSPYTSRNLVITLFDHHESKKEDQLCRDFQEIEKNKIMISEQPENVDWESELRLECNNINLSSELFINKVDRLINFWAAPQKISNKRKKAPNKPWMTKGSIKPIGIKSRLHKEICRLKDPLKNIELEIKLRNYKKILLRLRRNSKSNQFKNYFHKIKLNLFKTWEGIREIINISKNRKTDITSIQIGNKTVKKSSEIANEFNKHFTFIAKQIEEKIVKPKHKYYKYLNNPNTNSFFISPTNSDKVLSVANHIIY